MTPPENETKVEVRGSAFAELHLEGRWALSLLTKGWSDEERQALLDGDNEAKAEVCDALVLRIMNGPDESSVDHFELRIEGSPR